MKLASCFRIAGTICLILLANKGIAQTLSETDLVNALQVGGYVIVMRHASSPRQVPNAETADADNVNRERQLDETGRSDASALGNSLRRLRITITEVESSPAYRTLQTAWLAGFSEIEVRNELGSQGMGNPIEANATWLRERVANARNQGNLLLVTHEPNISLAFPALNSSPEEGEALVFDLSVSRTMPVARVRINEWSDL
jgi:phosphohistidine phosphatase SixA